LSQKKITLVGRDGEKVKNHWFKALLLPNYISEQPAASGHSYLALHIRQSYHWGQSR